MKILKMLGLRRQRPRWEQRRAGDRARDAREWIAAVAAYTDYLAANPNDWGIWVQRGHCQKEAGDLAGAERSYRHAADLAPQQADPFFQLAHIMRRMDRRSLAIDYYKRAVALGDRRALKDLRDLDVFIDLGDDDNDDKNDSTEIPVLPWMTRQARARTLLDARAARDLRQWDQAEALYTLYISESGPGETINELHFVQQARIS